MAIKTVCVLALCMIIAVQGQNPDIKCNYRCEAVNCNISSEQDCNAGEVFMQQRIWCNCCPANCCKSCVSYVQNDEEYCQMDPTNGHYKLCPTGTVCQEYTGKCVPNTTSS